MAVTNKRVLYGTNGVVIVRTPRILADAPVAGLWTPDNRNANESGVDPDALTLRGLNLRTARVVARFEAAAGGSASIEVEPIIAVPDHADPPGVRTWTPLEKVTLSPDLEDGIVIDLDGHDTAFRITGLTLDGGTDVTLVVTGGQFKGD